MRERVGAVFRWLAGVVVPMFAPPTAPAALAWFLHSVLLIAIAVGLYFAQPHLAITQNITRGPVWFRPFWLPALFLLAYLLAWSAVWLWQLLTPEQPDAVFPDIDDSWDEILVALDKAGIGLADTPLFFVIGEYPAGYDSLFRVIPQGLVVSGGSSPGSPIRAYASRDAIYLTIPGTSLLGIQAWLGDTEDDSDLPFGESVMATGGVGMSIGVDQSIGISIGGSMIGSVGVGQGLNEIQRIMRRAREENRPVTPEEKRRIQELSEKPAATPLAERGTTGGPTILGNSRLVAEATARLNYVCNRIAATRWPLCPLNGVIMAVPVTATDRDDAAQQWGLVAHEDLARIRDAMKLQFPVFALVGGMETLAGGPTFFDRFAADKGTQRLGKSFPLNPDIAPDRVAREVERSTSWVFGNLLPYHVYRSMRVEMEDETKENTGLFRLLTELRKRAPRFARLVSRAVVRDADPTIFGGCYLAVGAAGDPNDVKFAREFFKKVEHAQGAVAWTDQAYADDAHYRSLTRMGYMVLGLVLLVVLSLGVYAGYKHFG